MEIRMESEPSPFDGFRTHMLQNVVPQYFSDLPSEDVEILIKSQWDAMSETERDPWKKKKLPAEEPSTAAAAPAVDTFKLSDTTKGEAPKTTPSWDSSALGATDPFGGSSSTFKWTPPAFGTANVSTNQFASWTPKTPTYAWGSTMKLLIVGSGSVGKTSLMSYIKGEPFDKGRKATDGVSISVVEIETTKGKITFNCWDCGGSPGREGLFDGYYIGGQAAIIMFSVQDKASYKDAETKYRRAVERVCEKIPTCLVGNKVDNKDRVLKTKDITLHRKLSIDYVEVSVKSGYNAKKPFLAIIRKMFQDPSIQLAGHSEYEVSGTEQEGDKDGSTAPIAAAASSVQSTDNLVNAFAAVSIGSEASTAKPAAKEEGLADKKEQTTTL